MFKMGDYGFEGAGEFGGQDTNFNCKPDFHYSFCPNRKQGLQGDGDEKYSCMLTSCPDADGRGWGYNLCEFIGDDYHKCSNFSKTNK